MDSKKNKRKRLKPGAAPAAGDGARDAQATSMKRKIEAGRVAESMLVGHVNRAEIFDC